MKIMFFFPSNSQKNIHLTVLYAFPNIHLIGKSIRSWAKPPLTNDTVRFKQES